MSKKNTQSKAGSVESLAGHFSNSTLSALIDSPDVAMTRGLILSESNLWVPPNYHGTAAIADWLKAQLANRPAPAAGYPAQAYQDAANPIPNIETVIVAVQCWRTVTMRATFRVEQTGEGTFNMSDEEIRDTFEDCISWANVEDLLGDCVQAFADELNYDDDDEDREHHEDEEHVDTYYHEDNPQFSMRNAMAALRPKIRELLPQTYARCEGIEVPF